MCHFESVITFGVLRNEGNEGDLVTWARRPIDGDTNRFFFDTGVYQSFVCTKIEGEIC